MFLQPTLKWHLNLDNRTPFEVVQSIFDKMREKRDYTKQNLTDEKHGLPRPSIFWLVSGFSCPGYAISNVPDKTGPKTARALNFAFDSAHDDIHRIQISTKKCHKYFLFLYRTCKNNPSSPRVGLR